LLHDRGVCPGVRKGTVTRTLGRLRPRISATLLVTCLVGAGAVALPATAAVAAEGPTVVGDTTFDDGSYVVTLRDPAVASYEGGVSGLRATAVSEGESLDPTSAPVQQYREHLATAQEDVADSVGADITAQYSLATNGFAATLSAAQAQKLAADPAVQAVVSNEILQTQAAEPSTDFLGLSGDAGYWERFGTGEGVVVGIIDTGIAPENPSFAGEALGTDATTGDPYLSGSTITFDKADGDTFRGFCQRGEQFTADDCSTKIVGARYFVDGFGEGRLADAEQGEFVSPRDGDSHGSHTGSTAVGNADVPVTIDGRDFGTISGVAPDAKIAAYKVCWTGDATRGIADGCATADLLSAIDAAVQDGVDVINYSIGGGGADSTISLTDAAFFEAARTGIFVAASAGNSGPTASTVDNAAPWITTVAASTIPSYDATVRVTSAAGVATSYLGGSTSLSTDPAGLTGRFVDSDQVGLAGQTAENVAYCAPGSLDPAALAALADGDDAIVLCDRGVTDRVSKSAEVERIGGVGTVLVNRTPSSVDVDAHPIPTVHVDAQAYDALHASAQAGDQVTLLDGNPDALPEPVTPQIAGFSSRGPLTVDGGNLIKPDISAPGVAILAAGANAEGADPTYEFLSGTSMSSPHIAGIAALYLGQDPEASPMEVKSAMMTTAYDLSNADGTPDRDVFAQGAGHVEPGSMTDPGLLYLSDETDWVAYAETLGTSEDSQLNLPSIAVGSMLNTSTVTRTVTSTGPGTYTAQPVDLPGIDTVVTPSTLTFTEAGQEASYDITFTRTTAAPNEYSTGYLSWTDGGTHVVRSPLAVRPLELTAPDEVAGTGVEGSVPFDVVTGADLSEAVRADGLVPAQVEAGTGTSESAPVTVPVTVAADGTHGRFVLDSAVDEADLDLTLLQVVPGAEPRVIGQSATASADEQIDIELAPGDYQVRVEFFSGDGDLPFTLTSFLVPPAAAAAAGDVTTLDVGPVAPTGTFTVDPATLTAGPGETVTMTAAWSGLEYEQTYLGRVVYGDTGVETFVTVAAGAEPAPTDPGTPAPGDPGAPAPGDPGVPAPGDPGAAPAPGAPGTGAAGSGDPLAFTGQDLLPWAAAALLLLLAGAGVTLLGRRRAAVAADADATDGPSTEA